LTIAGFPQFRTAFADAESIAANAAARGREFLASLLDTELGLLPEYHGANVYWLYHDNYLAAKTLKSTHPEIAKRIEAAIRRHGVTESGKIEILFDEARMPLPFRQFKLVEVKQLGNKTLKTEVAGDQPFVGWREYADLLLLSAIAVSKSDPKKAQSDFEAASAMWDGHGFHDRAAQAAKLYASYKLALCLIAAAKLKASSKLQDAVIAKLLAQQSNEGGWITDYNAKGERAGLANVETTSLAIIALTER